MNIWKWFKNGKRHLKTGDLFTLWGSGIFLGTLIGQYLQIHWSIPLLLFIIMIYFPLKEMMKQ
jgi:hypothetical protein